MSLNAESYGASVRGPGHRSDGRPNEDAWLRADGSYGSLIVVCDGMGSRLQARLGARAACLAAREAAVRWARADGAPVSYFAHLIEVLWRLRIHPVAPQEAATTCLVALARETGEWVVGGLGDGLVAVMTGNTQLWVRPGRGESFSSETAALGLSLGPKAWQLSVVPPTLLQRVAVLATDGISDDLIPERTEAFVRWLGQDFGALRPAARSRRLAAELRGWPTPRHLDDKTLAVLSVPAKQDGGEPWEE